MTTETTPTPWREKTPVLCQYRYFDARQRRWVPSGVMIAVEFSSQILDALQARLHYEGVEEWEMTSYMAAHGKESF